MKNYAWVWVGVMLAATSVGCQNAPSKSRADVFRDKQLSIINKHKDELVKAGRITDPGHFDADLYLGTYSWHGDQNGSFGAYSFYQPAFEQAKKMFVIHGTVDADTDILVDESYGHYVPDKDGSIWFGTGGHSPIGKGAFDPSIVGYSVSRLTYCQSYGNHDKFCEESGLEDATVVRYIDPGHVQISKKAKHDAVMFGLTITPPGFVDMCACTAPTAPPTPTKPCTQGGSLGAGESCSISFGIQ